MPNKISPESSDGLFRTPLELFSLEREGRPVAGRPFHLFLSLRSTPLRGIPRRSMLFAPDAGRSAATGLAA